MSIKVKYDQSLIILLKSIFYESPTDPEEFVPIVKDIKNIPNIISFLELDNNSHRPLDIKTHVSMPLDSNTHNPLDINPQVNKTAIK